MEFGNIGGIALILAALVWLMVFVPSWARRSELKAREQNAKRYTRAAAGATTRHTKLLRTRATFALVSASAIIGSSTALYFQLIPGAVGASFIIAGAVAALVASAANRALTKLLASNYESRQLNREQVSRRLEQNHPVNEGWTPNPLPQPLNTAKRGELIAPSAEIIQFTSVRQSEPQTQSLNSAEIVEILKRRRAI
jgi:hypothetical protein